MQAEPLPNHLCAAAFILTATARVHKVEQTTALAMGVLLLRTLPTILIHSLPVLARVFKDGLRDASKQKCVRSISKEIFSKQIFFKEIFFRATARRNGVIHEND
jgi:hypothetical protein